MQYTHTLIEFVYANSIKKTSVLTATKEDYIRAIYLLQNNSSKGAGVTNIAKRLGLSKSTVSERMKELSHDGLVSNAPYTGITLTTKGRNEAEKLTYKHRVIEVFLNQVLQMHISQVHAEAEQLEHACSDKVIKCLANFLHNPKTDPHGTEIIKPKNW
ncbi:metal-dependent transcriptional regulator [Candidatus Nomurabacteria bacterium]|nr:metal-dependent transcriptional regulator [Candidatus Nomurabacteria bacterium]